MHSRNEQPVPHNRNYAKFASMLIAMLELFLSQEAKDMVALSILSIQTKSAKPMVSTAGHAANGQFLTSVSIIPFKSWVTVELGPTKYCTVQSQAVPPGSVNSGQMDLVPAWFWQSAPCYVVEEREQKRKNTGTDFSPSTLKKCTIQLKIGFTLR